MDIYSGESSLNLVQGKEMVNIPCDQGYSESDPEIPFVFFQFYKFGNIKLE